MIDLDVDENVILLCVKNTLHRLENSSIVLWCSETLKFLLAQLCQMTVNDNENFNLARKEDRQFSLTRFV